MNKVLKKVNTYALGLLVLAVPILLTVAFLYGATWFVVRALPWLQLTFYLAFGFSLFVLLPLSIFCRTRSFAAHGLIVSSYIFGLNLWCYSLILTLAFWGTIAVITGLCIAGIGVVPIAFMAVLFNAAWGRFIDLTFLLFLTFGCRFLGFYIAGKVQSEHRILYET